MKYLKGFIALVIIIEICSFLALHVAANVSGINLVYTNDLNTDLASYLNERNELTGWPSKSLLQSKNFTQEATRPNPYPPTSDSLIINIFGDSFARGAEVSDEHCWSNLLTNQTGVKTQNYAVDGFGTDQALLKFESLNIPDSDIVIAGFTSDNIMRNVNTFRNLLSADMRHIGLKPRFVLNDKNELEHIPLPGNNEESLTQILSDPAKLGPAEFFISDEGPQEIRWPFTISFVKIFQHYLIKSKIKGEYFYQAYFSKEHPSRALELTGKILQRFSSTSKSKKVLYLFFPQVQDFDHYEVHKKWIYQSLIDELKQLEPTAQILNLGDTFFGSEDFYDNRASYLAPKKHYSAKGNKVATQAVLERLYKLNWIEKI